jgi:pyruvate dehydrogenase E2 component (dihydrolipoamide acetyltransferase)
MARHSRLQLKALGVNISVNDMIIKACAKAMVDVPEVNRFYDAKADAVRAYTGGADICVAVATDGGLITPIVKSADRLGLFAINEAVKDLASRARAGEFFARIIWEKPPLC